MLALWFYNIHRSKHISPRRDNGCVRSELALGVLHVLSWQQRCWSPALPHLSLFCPGWCLAASFLSSLSLFIVKWGYWYQDSSHRTVGKVKWVLMQFLVLWLGSSQMVSVRKWAHQKEVYLTLMLNNVVCFFFFWKCKMQSVLGVW